jgi:hypothetical protein
MNDVRARWLRRWQIILAGVFFFGAILALGLAALRAPEVPFLLPGRAPWIWTGSQVAPVALWVDPVRPKVTTFDRRFPAGPRNGRVVLWLRAMRDVVVTLNDSVVPLSGRDALRWKEPSVVDVTPLLVVGENRIRAEVRNPQGFGFLQLRLDGLAEPLYTDERWEAETMGAAPGPATLADDGVRYGDGRALPTPLAALWEHALALLFLAGAGILGAARWQGRQDAATKAPAVALGMVAVYWVWFYAAKIIHFPAAAGFDGPEHVAFVAWLVQEKSLPLATAGFETYHPPLYHVLTALLVGALGPDPGGIGLRALLSLLPALSGLGMAFVAAATTRCLAPGAPWKCAGATLAAGFLPCSLTLAGSVSNELPHALLASLAVLATLRALLKERASAFDDLVVGLFLAAGALTKYTSLLLVPTLVVALVAKRILCESDPARQAALGAARTLALVAGLAGWFYARNWILFGDPLVSPLTGQQGKTLWQYPGFHTVSYFLKWGDAFTQPWYSGFHNFWDSLYTSWWGDGMLSGASRPSEVAGRWRFDWMAAVFPLAVPASVFVLVGWIRALRGAWRDDALDRRLALSLVAALPPLLLASLVNINLHYPFWSFGKGFYLLFLTPTLAHFGVLGFDALDGALARRAPRALRLLSWGWASAFFGSIALAYGG